MAMDMFLKIDDLVGDSIDDKHPKEIQVLSWSWGMSQSGSTHTATGGGSGVQPCAVQQQVQYGGSTAYCGQLVITTAGGQQSVDTVTVTIGGKHLPTKQRKHLRGPGSGCGNGQAISPACVDDRAARR